LCRLFQSNACLLAWIGGDFALVGAAWTPGAVGRKRLCARRTSNADTPVGRPKDCPIYSGLIEVCLQNSLPPPRISGNIY
jgi:hypothetical protein